jgi:farnesyl-diphosphate farnesyltransferase
MQLMDELLARTSRTFALAIPLLAEPTRGTTCLAYLLLRVADTLEDAELWSRESRLEALDEFSSFLCLSEAAGLARAEELGRAWSSSPPTRDAGCLDLLKALPDVWRELGQKDETSRAILLRHVGRTTEGMHAILASADERGRFRLSTIRELQHYCYIVAGIVGELLTELFLHDCPSLESVRATLLEHQASFGEGLQLVNILKDETKDATDGRAYLPSDVPRGEVFALARRDVAAARLYIDALDRGGAPAGYVGFTTLSVDLADATLVRLEEEGAGAKVSRAVFMQMFARIQQRIASGVR